MRIGFGRVTLEATMENWSNFYFMVGSSSATLTGLLFISVTFGQRIIRRDNIKLVNLFLATPLFHFFQVLVLSAVAEIPTMSVKWLGGLCIVFSVARLIPLVATSKLLRLAKDVEFSDWMLVVILPIILYVACLATGVAFLYDVPEARTYLAVIFVALIAIGVRLAWDMIVYVAMTSEEPPPPAIPGAEIPAPQGAPKVN